MKGLKLTDATKDEFVQFFATDVSGISCRYYFMQWLSNKRFQQVSQTIDEAVEGADRELKKYIDCVRAANSTEDFDQKMALFARANKHYEAYEKYDAEYNRLNKKIDSMLEISDEN